MLSAIANRTYDFVSNNMPTVASPSQMAVNISRVALPIVALTISNQLLFAEAGPLSCAVCYASCIAGTWGAFSAVCVATCAPFCLAPVP